jgi:hypothetical protein
MSKPVLACPASVVVPTCLSSVASKPGCANEDDDDDDDETDEEAAVVREPDE